MTANHTLRENERVVVIADLAGRRTSMPAAVRRQSGDTLEVVFADEVRATECHPVAVLAEFGGGHRLTAVTQSTPGNSSFMLVTDGRWRSALERRGNPRYPTMQKCVVRSQEAAARGACVDISMNGANIEVPAWGQQKFVMALQFGDQAIEVPCETVAVQHVMGTDVVHARFGTLSRETQQSLETIVDAIREDCLRAQQHLMLRANDPHHVLLEPPPRRRSVPTAR